MIAAREDEQFRTPSQTPAAYLYVLRLDGPELAWEYLRRNFRYREQWGDAYRESRFTNAASWGLKYFEDPALDARDATPCWDEELSGEIHLASYPRLRATATFALWKIKGAKSMTHDGSQIHVTARASRTARAALDQDITVDQPYAVLLPVADPRRCHRVCEEAALYAGITAPGWPAPRPSRSALVHMRALQAIDAAKQGASHREIAASLFGPIGVEREWSADGELRAQVRYYLKRGRALAGGGYRRLLRV